MMNDALVFPYMIGVRGRVTATLNRYKSGTEYMRWGPFGNLWVNGALDYFGSNGTSSNRLFPDGSGSNTTAYIAAGTGTNPPAATDTTLQTEITPSNTNRTNTNFNSTIAYMAGSPDYFNVTLGRQFNTSQANANITELGAFTANTSGLMFSRTLVKDNAGNPTNIPKTSAFVLNILWEYDWIPPQGDTVTTVTVNGVTYTVTSRAAQVGAASLANAWGVMTGYASPPWNSMLTLKKTNALVARTASPVLSGQTSGTLQAYVNGNYYRDYTAYSLAGITTASLAFSDGSFFSPLQIGFSPVIPSNQQISIRVTWNRYP